jgi:hypothetical protein
MEITVTAFSRMSPVGIQDFTAAVQRYGAFHSLPVRLV